MSKKIILEQRTENIVLWQIIAFVIAIMSALLVTSLMLYSSSQDVLEAFQTLFEGAFGGKEEILESLTRATPLILTGMATVVAFRAQIWSIGQEGQLILGGIIAYVASTLFEGLPAIVLLPVIIVAGFVGGALLGALCGWLKSKFGVDEIISTVMLNYVTFYFLTYLLSGPIMEPGSYYMQTKPLVDEAILPVLVEDTRFHGGIFIALIATIIVTFVINRTPLGYDIRAFGFNPSACSFKGTNVPRMFLIVMLISGGLAGLAGASEVMGIHGRVSTDLAAGLGYTGILVALIGGLTPLGTLLAAILFGGLINGGFVMQVLTNVPMAVVDAMQGIVLLFFLCSSLLIRYKIRRIDVSV